MIMKLCLLINFLKGYMKLKDEYFVKWCVWRKQLNGRFKPIKLVKTRKEALAKRNKQDKVSRLIVWSK